ncbi:porin [Vibrio cholerae]|uniref:Porin n=2 Tax=Vibrio cholerae TaxID=666 RepID=A0A395UBL7_VIBCL|nr:porin [Vibrio cholerae]ATD27787.1 Arginine/ornithine antiporter ArcD [Vibrio cholerae]EEO04181.1 outer membrane porin protein [Vibrio cholerae VL426]EGQ8591463.1 porin [Vibrio cholerae]EGQ8660579.1 porin [Vibrio cholerae]EGQ9417047.1 porin [Vibrio cholerae]
MDKMFKRTLLASTVAMVAAAGSANAAIDLHGKAVQLYGQAAGFVTISSPDKGDEKVSATIESRIGFRGVVEFEDFGPNLLWQIEGGNAGHGGFNPDTPWVHNDNGQLGARDTFLGLGFDGVGSIKYGRQLVAAYNYVDWPHSNPGLGNVFDWNNDIDAGYQDRADHVIRFDSETFGGFNFQATVSGMETTTDALVASIGASYQAGPVNLHGGYYTQSKYTVDNVDKGDINYGIIGATLGLDALTLTGAVKLMNNDLTDAEQLAYSATAQYVNNSWVYKLGYSGTNDAEVKGVKQADTADTAITARLGYLLPSTYLFMDLRNYKMNDADGFDHNLLIGAEYYF